MQVTSSFWGVRGETIPEMNVSRATDIRSAQTFYSAPCEQREWSVWIWTKKIHKTLNSVKPKKYVLIMFFQNWNFEIFIKIKSQILCSKNKNDNLTKQINNLTKKVKNLGKKTLQSHHSKKNLTIQWNWVGSELTWVSPF